MQWTHAQTEAIFRDFNAIKADFYSSLESWKLEDEKEAKRLTLSGKHAYLKCPWQAWFFFIVPPSSSSDWDVSCFIAMFYFPLKLVAQILASEQSFLRCRWCMLHYGHQLPELVLFRLRDCSPTPAWLLRTCSDPSASASSHASHLCWLFLTPLLIPISSGPAFYSSLLVLCFLPRSSVEILMREYQGYYMDTRHRIWANMVKI